MTMPRFISPPLLITWVILTWVLLAAAVTGASGQPRDLEAEMRRRAAAQYQLERLERFIEDTYRFFEVGGELVSFRVHPDMTPEEFDRLDDRSRELDDQAGRLISYVQDVLPEVRGRTDGLWVVLEPLDDTASLEDRLTLILALVNRLEPKIQQLVAFLSQDPGLAIPAEELRIEASLPYLVVGGLETLREMTRELRSHF